MQYTICLHNVNFVKIDSGRYFHLTGAHINFSRYISRPRSVAFDIRAVHWCQCHACCSLSQEAISPHCAIYCKLFRVPISSFFLKVDQQLLTSSSSSFRHFSPSIIAPWIRRFKRKVLCKIWPIQLSFLCAIRVTEWPSLMNIGAASLTLLSGSKHHDARTFHTTVWFEWYSTWHWQGCW